MTYSDPENDDAQKIIADLQDVVAYSDAHDHYPRAVSISIDDARKLLAEIARLRTALAPFAAMWLPGEPYREGQPRSVGIADFRAARAALGLAGEGQGDG